MQADTLKIQKCRQISSQDTVSERSCGYIKTASTVRNRVEESLSSFAKTQLHPMSAPAFECLAPVRTQHTQQRNTHTINPHQYQHQMVRVVHIRGVLAPGRIPCAECRGISRLRVANKILPRLLTQTLLKLLVAKCVESPCSRPVQQDSGSKRSQRRALGGFSRRAVTRAQLISNCPTPYFGGKALKGRAC